VPVFTPAAPPTPAPGFTVAYLGITNCAPQYAFRFSITNTGGHTGCHPHTRPGIHRCLPRNHELRAAVCLPFLDHQHWRRHLGIHPHRGNGQYDSHLDNPHPGFLPVLQRLCARNGAERSDAGRKRQCSQRQSWPVQLRSQRAQHHGHLHPVHGKRSRRNVSLSNHQLYAVIGTGRSQGRPFLFP